MIGNLPLPPSASLCTDPPIPWPRYKFPSPIFTKGGGGESVPRLLSPAKGLSATNTLYRRTNGKDLVILPGVW